MKPSVPAAPNSPWAVDDRPGGEFAATIAYSAGFRNANPVASIMISGTAISRNGDQRVRDPGHRRQDRPDDDERERAAPVDDPARDRREQQDRQAEHREREPDQGEVRPEALQVEAPDDLVRAARVVAAGVDHDGRDEAAIPQARGDAQAPDTGAVDIDVGRGPSGDRRRVRRELGRVVRWRRVGAGRRLADPEGDRQGREDRGHGAEHEHEGDAAEVGGPERRDRGPEQQAAHLGRAVQPERLTTFARRRRVRQVAARGRIVDGGTQAGQAPQQRRTPPARSGPAGGRRRCRSRAGR